MPSHERSGRFLSVGWKLAGSTVALLAIIALFAHVMFSRHERQSSMNAKQKAAHMLITLAAASLSAPLAFGDDAGVREQVNLLAVNEDIVYGAAWPVSHEHSDRLGRGRAEIRRGDVVIPKPLTIPERAERMFGDLLIAEAPVLGPSGKAVGAVVIAFSLEKERAAMVARERRTLAFTFTSASLLCGLLLLLARHSIVKPLSSLAQAARRLEEGEDAQIEIRSNDEIGDLASALRSMSDAVRDREASLFARNRDMRMILDNAGEGFLTVFLDGSLAEERSRILDVWFSPPEKGANVFDYFAAIAGRKTADWLRLGFESLAEGIVPIEVALDQMPKRFQQGNRFFTIEYRSILRDGSDELVALLVVVRDVTPDVERKRSEEQQKEALALLQHFVEDRAAFADLLAECRTLVDAISSLDYEDQALRRHVHTLKGITGLFGLERISRFCHELESRLAEDRRGPTPSDMDTLAALWEQVEQVAARFGARRDPCIIIDADEHRALCEAIRSGTSRIELERMVVSLAYEPASRRLASISHQIKSLGERLGKPDIQVDVAPTALRLPRGRWSKFWPVLVHVLRNAVDHGLESPAERARLGKIGSGLVSLRLERVGNEIVFSFSDDGRGIPWDLVARKAKQLGLDVRSQEDLVEALCSGSISTAKEVGELSGRGVGLSAVREAVRSLGGRIAVSSTEGRGTTVRFCFPDAMLCEIAA